MLNFNNLVIAVIVQEERRERRNIPKVQSYYEDILPLMKPDVFKQHFRFTRMQFEDLLRDLAPVHNAAPNINIWPLEKLCLCSIWTLATEDSYRSIGDRFGVSKSVVCRWLHYFTRLLIDVKVNTIKWPNEQEMLESVQQFLDKGFPGTIGCIDGTLIPISKPKENPESYITRKSNYAVNCLAVCNARQKFIYIYCGDPGSYHDSRVFRRSRLGQQIMHDDEYVHPHHLLGDKAYPISLSLMVPYEDNGYLTRQQIFYNQRLSSAHMIIEHSFGLLKNRFQRLKFLDIKDKENITMVITSCFIMHNIIVTDDDEVELHDIEDEQPYEYHGQAQRRRAAELKRQMICAQL